MRALLKSLLLWGLLMSPFRVSAEVLDINTATAEQFDDTLAGVGKAKAQAIVEDREKNGPFKSVDDLERVNGIGPAIIAKNRDRITVGAAATATPPEAKPKQK